MSGRRKTALHTSIAESPSCSSSQRRLGSSSAFDRKKDEIKNWIPAFAGMTASSDVPYARNRLSPIALSKVSLIQGSRFSNDLSAANGLLVAAAGLSAVSSALPPV